MDHAEMFKMLTDALVVRPKSDLLDSKDEEEKNLYPLVKIALKTTVKNLGGDEIGAEITGVKSPVTFNKMLHEKDDRRLSITRALQLDAAEGKHRLIDAIIKQTHAPFIILPDFEAAELNEGIHTLMMETHKRLVQTIVLLKTLSDQHPIQDPNSFLSKMIAYTYNDLNHAISSAQTALITALNPRIQTANND